MKDIDLERAVPSSFLLRGQLNNSAVLSAQIFIDLPFSQFAIQH